MSLTNAPCVQQFTIPVIPYTRSTRSVIVPFCFIASVVKELKETNETLKSLQTRLELAYASTASSGAPVAGGGALGGLGSVSYGGTGVSGTVLGGSVAVPGGVPGSTTLTAIMETKDARIQNLEKEVSLLEAELQRIKECGGRLREQLLKATAVPSGGGTQQQIQQQIQQQVQQQQQQQQLGLTNATSGISGIVEPQARQGLVTALGGPQQSGTLALARGPSVMTSLVPYGHSSSTALTTPLLAGSTGGTLSGSSGVGVLGGGSSCLAGISSGATTGVVNPYTDRYSDHHLHPHQLHHHQHHHHHHLHQQHQLQQQQQQQHQQHLLQQHQQQQIQQHLKQIEPAAAGALALHAHTFNKHDLNFKRQVSFFINNVRIEKNDAV
ncbi:hypothetical protein KPH14_005458 [Odynerus spinipes]|uniref:Uncharacterized protein n=1 Tax=Odynerus spinipes TaxID=1348599 RepID=A0AAD9RBQ6_9HYME|nr:hypothetical protein KPH14_005458 [Odynerus spinipes]